MLSAMSGISVKQARIFFAVAKSGSITKAAQILNRAQTSVTKSLQNMEIEVGATLFDRSTKGVALTSFGEILLEGSSQAMNVFETAAQLVPPIINSQSPGASRFFRMDVSDKWLDAFVATATYNNISVAGAHLDLSPAAISSSLRKFESSFDITLFARTTHGFVPTPFAESLVRYIKLARNYLQHAVDEIQSLKGNKTGSVTVGSLPFIRSVVLPAAINRLLAMHPNINVTTNESSYDELIVGLRCGDVDFLIGALRDTDADADIIETPLLEDKLSIIVREGHPLLKENNIDWKMLLEYPWLMPKKGTPTRILFQNRLEENGLEEPEHIIQTSSFVTLRGILLTSDRLTMLSRHQIFHEEQYGMLAVLDFELPQTNRAIGITRRALGTISPAAQLLIDQIEEVVQEINL